MQELLEESILKNLQIKDKRMKIELGKTYLTRDNRKVRIICTDRKSKNGTSIVGLATLNDNTESTALYYPDGRYLENTISGYDLVKEYSFWNDIKIDTKILVRDDESHSWHKRHFAGYEDGFVQSFAYGATFWSSTGLKASWKYAKLAEKD